MAVPQAAAGRRAARSGAPGDPRAARRRSARQDVLGATRRPSRRWRTPAHVRHVTPPSSRTPSTRRWPWSSRIASAGYARDAPARPGLRHHRRVPHAVDGVPGRPRSDDGPGDDPHGGRPTAEPRADETDATEGRRRRRSAAAEAPAATQPSGAEQARRRPPRRVARRARRVLRRRRPPRPGRQPLQGPRRDEPGDALGNDDGSGEAHAARRCAPRTTPKPT